MASTNPPLKGIGYTTEVALVSQSNGKLIQTGVTLAGGDVTVHKDGGSGANIGTLPTEIGSTGLLTVALTSAEMDADRVVVKFHDQAGAQWCDLVLVLHTVPPMMVEGSAVTGTLSTTQMTTDLTEATSDHFNGRIVIFTSGALRHQATDITDYDGATKMITMTALTEAPSNGDEFRIV